MTQPLDGQDDKSSDSKGFKYICLVHGPFMSGRVVVK